MEDARFNDEIHLGLTAEEALGVLDCVRADATRGLDDPLSLSPAEIRRLCFALSAVFLGQTKH